MRYLRNFRISANPRVVNWLVIVGSVLLCFLLSLSRLPGASVLGVGTNWSVIWLVTWSVTHNRLQSVIAAISVGLILDALTSSYPSHLFGLVLVAWLCTPVKRISTGNLLSYDNIIVVILRVFFLVLLVEGVMAIQYVIFNPFFLPEIWLTYQKVGLSSALLSSLWTPVLYYPLSKWWSRYRKLQAPST